jgi:carbonic anhydrase/acetyltransferase-like protein (isoleucine patch superfamily)
VAEAYRFLARSPHPLARLFRRAYHAAASFSLPAPRLLVRPLLALFVAVRSFYYFAVRVLVCEPLFKAYCTRYGRNLRTDVFVHWVDGAGELLIGDDVIVDGKCAFIFGSRLAEKPVLEIGDRTGIGHGCTFTVARRITIGRYCRIAGGVHMFDSSGHPADPEARRAGSPPSPADVQPITIGDNVWIGRNALVFPGVTVGENSIVAAGAVVTSDVPPGSVVAGNPARRIAKV